MKKLVRIAKAWSDNATSATFASDIVCQPHALHYYVWHWTSNFLLQRRSESKMADFQHRLDIIYRVSYIIHCISDYKMYMIKYSDIYIYMYWYICVYIYMYIHT